MCKKFRQELKLGALALIVSSLITGCALTPEEQATVDSVMTALPTEVAQCTFLGDVSTSSFTLPAARIDLKLQVAALGGNHLVETSVNTALSPSFGAGFGHGPHFYGADTIFYLSGRAYFCPEGTGVKGLIPKKKPVSEQLIDGPLPKGPAEQGSLNQDTSTIIQPQALLFIPDLEVDELIPHKPFLAGN